MSTLAGDSVARRFLTKAFGRAQAAQSRGDTKPVRILLNRTQCPEFFASRDLDDARQFRAELAAAERNGAIQLEPAKRRTPPNDVQAVVVVDLEVLGARLGLDVRSNQVAQARNQLAPYLDTYPVLDLVLGRWKAGKSVRGAAPGTSAVHALLDAIRVREERQGRADEALLRRVSSHLFQVSKRIEKLDRWLDLLAEGSLVPSGLKRREIFSALGLQKEPQPFLVAANVVARNGQVESRLFRPYHGLPMAAITGFRFEPTPSCVVTVENKATFHEMAVLAEGTNACVIYSGGMPGPAWKQVYAAVLASVSDDVPLFHTGDIDVGGFRIARAIADVARGVGRHVRPWRMDPAEIVEMGYQLRPAKPAQTVAMQALCVELGWQDVCAAMSSTAGLLEQEHLMPSLPA